VLGAIPSLILAGSAAGQQVHRNGFEGRDPVWVKGNADVAFHETRHVIADTAAHGGQRSEYLQITAEQGNFVYYHYPTGHALVTDELNASLWAKGNRPGVQILARVVFPHEQNPNNLTDHLTTLIRGDRLRAAGHWERLEIRRPCDLVKQQQGLMQASLKRPINIKDAYIDMLLLNVYGGQGSTEVWIDDLELSPVLDPITNPEPTATRPDGPSAPQATPASRPKSSRPVIVEHSQDQLFVGGKRFFLRGIRYSDTPLDAMRDAGFNTLFVDSATPPTRIQEAVDLGFWLVPSLPDVDANAHLVSADRMGQEVSRFPAGDAVLFWDMGGALTYEQAARVQRTAQLVRSSDPGRPIGGDVWDGFVPYSRNLDLVGAHRWPLMTTLELPRYRDWLNQRRLLANPGTFMWTWIQTHLPDWYTAQVYEQSAADGFKEPIGPQPEQIRLLTYTALASGCKGVGFWSDRFLADTHQGRDRLQVLALLNQELQMLEPLLLTVSDPPVWIDTSIGDVKAAVLRSPRGVLVLPMWLGSGAQFVPGQSAVTKLTMVVPQVPQGTQAWEVQPGDMRGIHYERQPGGYKITIPEFGLTTAIVFTSDNALVVRFQEQVRAHQQLAAQWTRDLAHLELAKVLRVEQLLERAGHTLPDSQKLLKDARDRLRQCDELWNGHLYGEAYREAQRAVRPVRILMRAQWEGAVRGLTTPVASTYAVSFYTLPRHWALVEHLGRMTLGANVLPDGGFEVPPSQAMASWVRQDTTLDEVDLTARRVTEVVVEMPRPRPPAKNPLAGNSGGNNTPTPPAAPPPVAQKILLEKPKEGNQCLLLEIKPKNPQVPLEALQRTFLAIHTPAVKLPPGTWVAITAWIRIPKAITASADGALLYDSAAGEPFAVRLTDPTPWKQFVLYRRVPASGMINVTLAMTGLGKAYFDDVRIQPLTLAVSTAAQGPVSGR
jgi:hypothetical protein